MKCFISKNYRRTDSAGDKAKTDIEAILARVGYKNIGLRQRRVNSAVGAYFITLASVLKGVLSLKKGDILVVQYPLKKYYDFVVSRANARGAKVITVIHDLGSFRRKKLTVAQEVKRLNRSAAVVVHSPAMRRWLADNGVTVPMIELGLFDYLSDSVPAAHDGPGDRYRLMFAGNASPVHNDWIYQLGAAAPSVDVIVYGGGIDESKLTPNIHPMGYVDSDTLIATAQGDFGVVWYGSSLDEGAGALGEYLKYNAPHKTSLYLRSGLPVIIWDQAALSGIVKEYNVGICVSSLRDVPEALSRLTPRDYAVMKANAEALVSKLAKGSFIIDAVDRAEKVVVNAL